MLVGLLENILSILIIPALILHILHYKWFERYLELVLRFLQCTLNLTIGVIYGVILTVPKAVIGFLKSIIVIILTFFLALIYLVTYLVPWIGKIAQFRGDLWEKELVSSYIIEQAHTMREIMVRIVAEEDEHELKYDNSEDYRKELKQIKQDAKTHLEAGATILSITLGVLLISAKITGIGILQTSLLGISASLLIESWLLVIAVSIIYRSSVLDLLAYGPDAEFDSLDEMDAALGYQQSISLVGIIQGLMFLLVFMAAISKVRYNLIEDALRAMYTDQPWITYTWKQLTK